MLPEPFALAGELPAFVPTGFPIVPPSEEVCLKHIAVLGHTVLTNLSCVRSN